MVLEGMMQPEGRNMLQEGVMPPQFQKPEFKGVLVIVKVLKSALCIALIRLIKKNVVVCSATDAANQAG